MSGQLGLLGLQWLHHGHHFLHVSEDLHISWDPKPRFFPYQSCKALEGTKERLTLEHYALALDSFVQYGSEYHN